MDFSWIHVAIDNLNCDRSITNLGLEERRKRQRLERTIRCSTPASSSSYSKVGMIGMDFSSMPQCSLHLLRLLPARAIITHMNPDMLER
jgi:hypothetical protein